jgi:hypothetical protein
MEEKQKGEKMTECSTPYIPWLDVLSDQEVRLSLEPRKHEPEGGTSLVGAELHLPSTGHKQNEILSCFCLCLGLTFYMSYKV